MKFLAEFLSNLLTWFFGRQLDKIDKPKTLEDANTPKNISADWDHYITDELRDKTSDSDKPNK